MCRAIKVIKPGQIETRVPSSPVGKQPTEKQRERNIEETISSWVTEYQQDKHKQEKSDRQVVRSWREQYVH